MIHGYDNYKYGDGSYSKYPTDNKKYESRTGYLKAICRLLKFCNVRNSPKKDDRKEQSRDNKTIL
jgi:hypothetical protein